MNLNLLIKAASFVPSRLESSDAWTGHVPFAHWLISILNPAVFVELGTFSGNSYLAFCQAVKENNLQTRCYGVDTWKGDVHSGFYNEDIFASLDRYHSKAYAKFSSLLRLTFDEAIYYFPDHSIDLLHIDGLHTYDAVKHDFETWLPKLTPQAVVIFHDTNVREREFGVWRFWQELCQKYPYHFEFVHSHGLGVLQLASEPIHPDLDFLNPDFSFRQLFLDYFASLGQRITDQYHRQELEKTIIDFKQEVDAHQATLQSTQTQLIDRDAQTAALQAQKVEQEQLVLSLQAQLADKEKQIVELAQQISTIGAEKTRLEEESLTQTQRAQSFQSQIAEYDRLSLSLQTQLTETEQYVQALQTQLAERTQQVENLQVKVGEQTQQTEALQQKQAEWELQLTSLQTRHSQELEALQSRDSQDLESLRMQLAGEIDQKTRLQNDLANLKNYANQREQILQDLNNKLLEIYSSTAWKLIQWMWKARLWLAPKDSRREQFARRIAKIFQRASVDSKLNIVPMQQYEDHPNLLSVGSENDHGAGTAIIKIDNPTPVVSIIIPVYNALSMTKACVESLYRFTEGHDFEVIVINNASEDGTFQWLNEKSKQLAKLNVVKMEKNIGFGPAVNIGLQSAKGKYLVILNNDTLVSPGWLFNLISALKKDPSIGIVSPVTNYVGEGPQIDPQAQNLQPTLESVAEYAQTINERSEVYYEPNRLVFFCVLLRRELVDLIGYLDEGYLMGNFEDDDYCMRTRTAGYRLAIARNAFVYHHGTVTFKLNQIPHDQWMETNRNRFYQKAGRIATLMRPCPSFSSTPMISVIMRTKNRPKLLKKALRCLANQTYHGFEVVLVNDGGDDIDHLVNFFTAFFPITYIHHKDSLGRTAAINAGMRQAKCTWVGYLDDDDIVYPWHLEVLKQGAEQSGARVVYSDYNRAMFLHCEDSTPNRIVGTESWDYNHQQLLITNYLPIHTYIHQRNLYQETGPWNEELDRLEDYDFLLRLSAICDFHHVRKVTCEYRFYLDSGNSIFNGRLEYLTALQKIYPHYQVEDELISIERQKVIEGLRAQSDQIEELLKNAEVLASDPISVRRKILKITTGI